MPSQAKKPYSLPAAIIWLHPSDPATIQPTSIVEEYTLGRRDRPDLWISRRRRGYRADALQPCAQLGEPSPAARRLRVATTIFCHDILAPPPRRLSIFSLDFADYRSRKGSRRTHIGKWRHPQISTPWTIRRCHDVRIQVTHLGFCLLMLIPLRAVHTIVNVLA